MNEYRKRIQIKKNNIYNYYKRMIKQDSLNQQQVWFLYINEESRGPMGLRDIDVLLRTNQINSRVFCWKNGMKQWKPMIQIQQIKQSILDSSNQILEIEKKNNPLAQNENGAKPNQNQVLQPGQDQDHMVQNQDQDPLQILEVTVQNLLKKSFTQNEDGKWSIYDEQKEEWVLQDQQPIQKIAQMKSVLLNKLKSQFFADEKNKRKFKPVAAHNQEPEVPLTKQQLQKKERNKKKTKRAAEKKKQKWYQAKINTFVYISGLPFDITEQELKQFACRAGVLRINLSTGEEKLKIYKDENNLPKGDAAVSYAREQSVQIALEMLNDSEIRPGFKVKVEKAQFNQKEEEYKKRETKKQNKVKKMLAKKNEEKLFGWDDELEQKGDGFRIVIMKYVFTQEQANNEQEISQIKADIQSEMSKFGQIKRIRFFQTHPDGVVEIKFDKDIDAQKCVQVMNGRYFDGRELVCEYWDGQTDYKLDASSIALQKERLLLYANQLEGEKQKKIQIFNNQEQRQGLIGTKQSEQKQQKKQQQQVQQVKQKEIDQAYFDS